jgi:hypothetical protein
MALRQTTRRHTDEALREAQLLVLPVRADAKTSLTAPTEETVMDQSLSAKSQSANRRLRNLIILANACVWLAVIAAIRFFFF